MILKAIVNITNSYIGLIAEPVPGGARAVRLGHVLFVIANMDISCVFRNN